jgi:hypothetical protein
MADFFVKSNGSDINNGTTWSLAKATVQAGLTLCTTAGDRCVVAAGRYYEKNLAPASAGTRAAPKTLIGDYNGTITDGGALTSGATGYITIDASVQSGNKGWDHTAFIVASSNNWAYWNIKAVRCTGGSQNIIGAVTQWTVNDSIIVEDCTFESSTFTALNFSNWKIDAAYPIYFKRCIIVCSQLNIANPAQSSGVYFFCNGNNGSNTPSATPNVIFERCMILGLGVGIFYESSVSGGAGNTEFRNCTVGTISMYTDNTTFTGLYYRGSTTSGVTTVFKDCFLRSMREKGSSSTALTPTYTNCKKYFETAIASDMSQNPSLLPILYLAPDSALIDTDTAGSSQPYPDLFGQTAMYGSDDDFGAQEFVATRYPKEPTMNPGTGNVKTINGIAVTNIKTII